MKLAGLLFVRYGIALVLAVVGGILLQTRTDRWAGLGIMLVGAAIILLMINILYRLSLRSNRERDREEEARDYFDEHGQWPAWYR